VTEHCEKTLVRPGPGSRLPYYSWEVYYTAPLLNLPARASVPVRIYLAMPTLHLLPKLPYLTYLHTLHTTYYFLPFTPFSLPSLYTESIFFLCCPILRRTNAVWITKHGKGIAPSTLLIDSWFTRPGYMEHIQPEPT